jgi:hypothetical protein
MTIIIDAKTQLSMADVGQWMKVHAGVTSVPMASVVVEELDRMPEIKAQQPGLYLRAKAVLAADECRRQEAERRSAARKRFWDSARRMLRSRPRSGEPESDAVEATGGMQAVV